MKNKKILIFGSSGFLGSHLVKELTKDNDVIQFDTNPPIKKLKKIKYVKGSILDKAKILKAMNKVDVVYHFAAMTDIDIVNKEPAQAIEINIAGTANILDCCVENKIERFIFSSSVYVYSKYGGVYKSTKQACELLIKDYNKMHGLNYSILQLGSVYGPNAKLTNLISRFIHEGFTKNEINHYGSGNEIRQYIYVKDVVVGAISLINDIYKNKKIILIGNESITINELMDKIIKLINPSIQKSFKVNKYKAHYKTSPFDLDTRGALKFNLKSNTKLKSGLIETIDSIKTEIKNQRLV